MYRSLFGSQKVCAWGHGCTGSNHSQELFPYVYVSLGVVTSVWTDWEGVGCVGGDWCAVIKWGILLHCGCNCTEGVLYIVEDQVIWYLRFSHVVCVCRANFMVSKKTVPWDGSHLKVNIKSVKGAKCLLFGTALDRISTLAIRNSHRFTIVIWAVIGLTKKIWPFVGQFNCSLYLGMINQIYQKKASKQEHSFLIITERSWLSPVGCHASMGMELRAQYSEQANLQSNWAWSLILHGTNNLNLQYSCKYIYGWHLEHGYQAQWPVTWWVVHYFRYVLQFQVDLEPCSLEIHT